MKKIALLIALGAVIGTARLLWIGIKAKRAYTLPMEEDLYL